MRRAVLKQQHPRQRTPLALLAVLAPQRRLTHQSSRLQSQPGDRIAKLVVVLPDQGLVKVPNREIRIIVTKQLAHPADLGRVGATGRSFPKPSVTQSRLTLIVKPDAQAAELAPRNPKQFARLISTQTSAPKAVQRIQKPAHEDIPQCRLPPHVPPLEQGMNIPDNSRANK